MPQAWPQEPSSPPSPALFLAPTFSSQGPGAPSWRGSTSALTERKGRKRRHSTGPGTRLCAPAPVLAYHEPQTSQPAFLSGPLFKESESRTSTVLAEQALAAHGAMIKEFRTKCWQHHRSTMDPETSLQADHCPVNGKVLLACTFH